MYQNKLQKYIIATIFSMSLIYFFNFSSVYCTGPSEIEDDNIVQNELSNLKDNTTDIENQKAKKDELLKIIKELVQTLANEIKGFDDKINDIRSTDEYLNYPAIRLNIDTPLFGLNSIVENKLKITKDVSANDIANAYSIKSIIKNGSILLPDTKLGLLVISTKEVKFDDNISLNDANSAISKLIQYEKTLKNIDTFIDDQINKFFKGYIPKDKKQNIENISVRLNRLGTLLQEQDIKLLKIEIISISDENSKTYEETLKEFENLSGEMKKERKEIQNMLLSYDDITDIQKRLIDAEINMSTYSKKLDDYLDENKSFNELEMLSLLKDILTSRKDKIEKYIDNATLVTEISKQSDEFESNMQISKQENDDTSIENKVDSTDKNLTQDVVENKSDNELEGTQFEVSTEEKKVYDITYSNILDELESCILKVDEKIKEYESKSSDTDNTKQLQDGDETIAKDDDKIEDSKAENEIADRKEKLLGEMILVYKEFLAKENKFYTDNMNLLLQNTTNVISDLAKYTTSELTSDMKYIYLSLPDKLENNLENTNLNLNIELKELSNNLHKEIIELVNLYVKVERLYDELEVDDIKAKA
ncbi:unknown [Clostridium sp. CAG:921]|nr:unknown [Clostridium sp. CAG:921]